MTRIKYPIGIQTFSKVIAGGYVYVDKTELVYDIANRYDYVFLSRPRRFGKSLLMSTLEAYFRGEKELFSGLAIEGLEKEWTRHPVFRFDFSPANYVDSSRLCDHIEGSLRHISEDYSIIPEGANNSIRFLSLIKQTYEKYGQKVVILIDEYDKPLLDCMHDPELHEALKAELRSFYSVIKDSDRYIRFAMLTGITKFGKISGFSGLNNLKDISMMPRYNSICGISETEFRHDFKDSIAIFADEHDIPADEAWNQFRRMYDGYHFATRGEGIYNPFSVINAFDENQLRNFWFESGSPSYLIRLIERNHYRLDSLDGQTRTDMQLNDISDTSADLVPLLFQSGYLTITDFCTDTGEYVLGFPNLEVDGSFWKSLADRFFMGIGGESAFDLRRCLGMVRQGHAEEFMLSMRSLLADTDAGPERNKEIHFQNMMVIAAKMMGLAVRTEVHSAKGRCDMQIHTPEFVYIFEFKIDGTPGEAMAQIIDRGYAVPFEAERRTVFLIGANFSTADRTLDSWIIEKLR